MFNHHGVTFDQSPVVPIVARQVFKLGSGLYSAYILAFGFTSASGREQVKDCNILVLCAFLNVQLQENSD